MITKEQRKELFQELRSKTLSFIEGYKTDLVKHDRRWMRHNPGVPFIHMARKYGTYLTPLNPFETYPPDGQYVPYLFAQADRWHILKESSCMVNHCIKEYGEDGVIVHYYDGKRLRKTTLARAVGIVNVYQSAMRSRFHSDNGLRVEHLKMMEG